MLTPSALQTKLIPKFDPRFYPHKQLLNYWRKGKGKRKERLNLHNIDCVHSQNSTLKSKEVFRGFFFLNLTLKPMS